MFGPLARIRQQVSPIGSGLSAMESVTVGRVLDAPFDVVRERITAVGPFMHPAGFAEVTVDGPCDYKFERPAYADGVTGRLLASDL